MIMQGGVKFQNIASFLNCCKLNNDGGMCHAYWEKDGSLCIVSHHVVIWLDFFCINLMHNSDGIFVSYSSNFCFNLIKIKEKRDARDIFVDMYWQPFRQ